MLRAIGRELRGLVVGLVAAAVMFVVVVAMFTELGERLIAQVAQISGA